jgi:metal-responsive CopG/Arc/MetJ family transcriptional regulator
MSTTTESRTKNPVDKPSWTAVGVRIPPKLLGRLDTIIARRQPARAKLIKNLVRQALKARDERSGNLQAEKSAPGRAQGCYDRFRRSPDDLLNSAGSAAAHAVSSYWGSPEGR